ncbi:MAG TPA: hypothetical protein VL202_10390 [Pararhizobium sp.]|nr:hypothetical protein [Pararhizobium sp.]HTO31567.1 hypothetical protein [Pararhizobium sp.]
MTSPVAIVTGPPAKSAVRLPFGHGAASRISRGDGISLGFDPASARVFAA